MADSRWQGEIEERVAFLARDIKRATEETNRITADARKEAQAVEGRLSLQLADLAAQVKRLADSFDLHQRTYQTFVHRLSLAIVAILAVAAPGSLSAVRAILGFP